MGRSRAELRGKQDDVHDINSPTLSQSAIGDYGSGPKTHWTHPCASCQHHRGDLHPHHRWLIATGLDPGEPGQLPPERWSR